MAQNLAKIQQSLMLSRLGEIHLRKQDTHASRRRICGRPISPLRSPRSRMSKILPDANNEGEHRRIMGYGLANASPYPTDSHKFSFVRNRSRQPDTDALIGRRYSFWNGFSG